jgi:hypothetical protein
MSHPIDRAQINRNNAYHSTGPRTEAGKQRSCLNALRHGLTSQTVVMPAEDLEAYQRHVQSFVDEYRPKGATETQLVQSLADAAWRINRVAVLETNLLTHDIVYEDFPNHESTHEMREAIAIAAALDSHTRALSTLSLHGQRLSRQFEKTLALLQQLQSTRLANEVRQPANLVEVHGMEQESQRPAADGFVFSDEEIGAGVAPDDRQPRASDAQKMQRKKRGQTALSTEVAATAVVGVWVGDRVVSPRL